MAYGIDTAVNAVEAACADPVLNGPSPEAHPSQLPYGDAPVLLACEVGDEAVPWSL
jgi:hypothetical protein